MNRLTFFSTVLFSLLGLVIFSVSGFGQRYESIPPSATILETVSITPKRELVLWMAEPKKYPNNYAEDDIYTCPDQTRGSYYSGPVRVSLINPTTNEELNTVKVQANFDDESGEIDLPYTIRAGFYYHVPGGNPKAEIKPQIMLLKDYNGDGKAFEFALFNAEACMGLGTTLIGYSGKHDRVIQYPISMKSTDETATLYWLDYLFAKNPISPGVWNYEIDYRGRGGTLDKFSVQYDKSKEEFRAVISRLR